MLKLALRDLSTARLRTVLTILGVIIGTGLVVATLIGGESVTNFLAFEAVGPESRMLILSPGTIYPEGGFSLSPRPIFDQSIVNEIAAIPEVEKLYPVGYAWSIMVEGKGTKVLMARGAIFLNPSLLEEFGAKFIDRMEDKRDGIIFPKEVAERLNVRVGDKVPIEVPSLGIGESYTVIGIFERLKTYLGGLFTARSAYLPIDNWSDNYEQIYVIVRDIRYLEEVREKIINLTKQHLDIEIQDMDIVALSLSETARGILNVVNTVIRYVLFTGFLSLLLGGLGLSNTMLMNLKERIKEIGILKSLGMSNRNICMLYLIEASIIGAVGGFIGVTLGITIAFVAIKYMFAMVPFSISFVSLATGPLVGFTIGLIFGAYPAIKASRIALGEALRWEW